MHSVLHICPNLLLDLCIYSSIVACWDFAELHALVLYSLYVSLRQIYRNARLYVVLLVVACFHHDYISAHY